VVKRVSADASEQSEREAKDAPPMGYKFRSIIELKSQVLESDGMHHALTPGMQVDAEIALGERTVLEYILSPVRKAFHEAARER
jgi:membrane fusion protein, hemolysin D